MIELVLDEITARILRDSLVELGEHLAVGAPIGSMDSNTSERLAAVIATLDVGLGREPPHAD